MFTNLVEVGKDIRADLVEVYWILLVPLVCFLIAVELLKDSSSPPNGGQVLKRVVISVLLLLSFDIVINIIGMIGDGIIDKVDKLTSMKEVLKNLGPTKANLSNEWFNLREHILYAFSIIAYIVAYLGFFVAEALTHFVWVILYTISPLMILAYVPKQTSNITANLYKGLVKVVLWKLVWSILGALLLKMAMEPQITGMSDWILSIVINFCIGLAMLFVPMATKSLINDGFEGAASALSAAPAFAATGAVKAGTTVVAKRGKNLAKRGAGFVSRPTKNVAKRGVNYARDKLNVRGNVERPMNHLNRRYSELGMNQEQRAQRRAQVYKELRKVKKQSKK